MEEKKEYTIHEAKEYLGIQGSGRGNKDIKDIYKLFNTGEIKCWKGKARHKWLTNKENLDAYLATQKESHGNGTAKEVMKVQQSEQVYTIKEAAQLLSISNQRIYEARNSGVIPARTDGNGNYVLNQEDIEKVRRSRYGTLGAVKVQPIEPAPLPVQVVEAKPPEQRDDSRLLQDILSATFAFLSEHSFPIGMKSFEEVEADFRHWIVKTPDTTLDIVATDGQITVLAEKYQKELEEKVVSLSAQLKKAETTLSLLRQKKREVFLPYAYSLPVWVEQRHEGVLVWCSLFPFSALGKDEQEALAAFKRTLRGYCWQLRTHEKELTPELRAQFETLKELLVED